MSCAGALPLTVQADLSLLWRPLDGLREVFKHIGRVRELQLSDGGQRDETEDLFRGIRTGGSIPNPLETLWLRSEDIAGCTDSRLASAIFQLSTPSLKTLRIDNWALDFRTASHALRKLTNLQLISVSCADYNVLDFMTALAAMGDLQMLTLNRSLPSHQEIIAYDIALPNLTCLDMEDDVLDCNAMLLNFRLSRPLVQFRLHCDYLSHEQELPVLRSMIQQSRMLKESSDGPLFSLAGHLSGLSFGHFSQTQGSVRFELSAQTSVGYHRPTQITGQGWRLPALSVGCSCFVEDAESFLSHILGIVSIHSVSFANFFGFDMPQSCWDILCRELRSVQVLLASGCNADSMARALMPVLGQELPAPKLQRLLLFEVGLDACQSVDVPTLQELIAVRQSRGSWLEVSEVNPRLAIGARGRDWVTLQSQGLDAVWDVVKTLLDVDSVYKSKFL
ncbi:hypothetical protein CONPUDRAFT_81221 [Coniophora puteana RWD-64-598 SS2]|uniref:RNI-like protein n=1 Tax=Coniophora puteana (strain RWD-64-598) TaxID=741705 RepID=A0A5M3MVH8_CONPW|nr:uncharacterized protein CONPUDRAFT_81221 [Coniophora puteana RWD-64-598 SS2]EIW83172.1 hypothetical protein CONPUDRAFT_81221 [Coniophora puteana RWD-64-598 SS2]